MNNNNEKAKTQKIPEILLKDDKQSTKVEQIIDVLADLETRTYEKNHGISESMRANIEFVLKEIARKGKVDPVDVNMVINFAQQELAKEILLYVQGLEKIDPHRRELNVHILRDAEARNAKTKVDTSKQSV